MISECIKSNIKKVVIIGGSGFIGARLISELTKRIDLEIWVLVHQNRARNEKNIHFVEGDLLKTSSLDALLSKDCIVINLAYLTEDNIVAIRNLAMACAKNEVGRLIHCSTAVVVGRTKDNCVTENTLCTPISEYEQTKLHMETVLLEIALGKFDVLILRPTAVFGPGGKNLLKLANELALKSSWVNYLRSCLFNRRRMNLVCVENVVAALIFLIDAKNIDQEVFIISDDDSQANNYRDIENQLLTNFGKSYLVPRIFIPEFILRGLLLIVGKSNINPSLKYSDQKLTALGFKKPKNLEIAIDDFAEWYKNTIQSEA